MEQKIVYRETSDSEPSEIGTQYNRPLYKEHRLRPQKLFFPIILIYVEPPKEDNLSTKGTGRGHKNCSPYDSNTF